MRRGGGGWSARVLVLLSLLILKSKFWSNVEYQGSCGSGKVREFKAESGREIGLPKVRELVVTNVILYFALYLILGGALCSQVWV